MNEDSWSTHNQDCPFALVSLSHYCHGRVRLPEARMDPTLSHAEASTYFSDMEFSRSTQNRSWMFDDESLEKCRHLAVSGQTTNPRSVACKFASGFHFRDSSMVEPYRFPQSTASFSSMEQETLIRFHAHQIQALVGPAAVLSSLRTREDVVATSVIFLRRFYLSNKVSLICPRMMTAACCFLAAKVEEDRVDIEVLSHATSVVQLKVRASPLCSEELRNISVGEIEEGERLLMEGLNYELHCFHAYEPIRHLAPDVAEFLGELGNSNKGRASPVGVVEDEESDVLVSAANDIVRRATVFSDLPFLFSPSHIAFAAVTITTGDLRPGFEMGEHMEKYLLDRFPRKSGLQVLSFMSQVNDIINRLVNCPWMDLFRQPEENRKVVAERAKELRRALRKASYLRCQQAYHECQRDRAHKRLRTPGDDNRVKLPRVTPISSSYGRV